VYEQFHAWLLQVSEALDPESAQAYATARFLMVPLGGVLVSTLLVRSTSRRLAGAALLGVLAPLLFIIAWDIPFPASAGWIALGAMVGVLFSLAILGLTAHKTGRALQERFAKIVSPREWGTTLQPPPGTQDAARRWYVSVAAATGAIIGGLLTDPSLIEVVSKEALKISSIFATVIMSLTYFALAGPLHERIFGAAASLSSNGGDDEVIVKINAMTSRSIARMVLILILFFALDFLFHCVDESIHSGSWRTLAVIIYAGIAPGVVSYYWSAALQKGADSVRATTVRPSIVLGATMLAPGFILVGLVQLYRMVVIEAVPDFNGFLAAALLTLGALAFIPLMILAAWLGGFVFFGIYAVAGGLALDRYIGTNEMAWLLGFLLIPAAVIEAVFGGVVVAKAIADHVSIFSQLPVGQMIEPFSIVAGWGLGLYASGFPHLVERRRRTRSVAAG
jgi:hypothetical protein